MRFALICAAIALAAAAGPKGSYCGGVDGIVSFRIDQVNASYMNITASIFGAGLTCPDQIYKYDDSTNKISLPGLSDPKNCIGKVLNDQGIDPDSVQVEYDPDSDSISIGADIGSVELEQCPKKGQRAAPSGMYCGRVDGIVEMHVTILTSTVLNITFSLFGQAFICPKTEYVFDSATNLIKPVGIADTKTCLGKALADQGIDADSVSITFDEDEDALQVNSEVGDVLLTKCTKSAKLRMRAGPPKGAFCGGVDGILTLRVGVTDASWLNVTATLFGMTFGCYKEAWKYDTATSKIILPGLSDPKDCIGKVLNDQGVDPDSVAIQYDSDSDSVSIQANLGQIELDQCPKP